MEDPRIISALFISLKMAYYNVLINTVSYFDFVSHYLIRGNGWVIEATLLLITFLLWIGNNYYWNKQSEKYNWK